MHFIGGMHSKPADWVIPPPSASSFWDSPRFRAVPVVICTFLWVARSSVEGISPTVHHHHEVNQRRRILLAGKSPTGQASVLQHLHNTFQVQVQVQVPCLLLSFFPLSHRPPAGNRRRDLQLQPYHIIDQRCTVSFDESAGIGLRSIPIVCVLASNQPYM